MAVFYFHVFLCVAMTALMWFMQVVHYPLMTYTDAARWQDFLEKRRMWTRMIMYPLMSFEILTGFTLVLLATQTGTYYILAAEFLILLCSVIYHFAYLSPFLKKISGPNDDAHIQKFVQLHWVRTLGWTFRFLLIVLILLGSAR